MSARGKRAKAPASQRGFAWSADGDAVHERVARQLARHEPVASTTADLADIAATVADFGRHRSAFVDAFDGGGPWPMVAVMADSRGLGAPALTESIVGVGVDRAALAEALASLEGAAYRATVSWYRLRVPLKIEAGDRCVLVSPLMLCPHRMTAGEGLRATDGCACRDCASLRRWGQP